MIAVWSNKTCARWRARVHCCDVAFRRALVEVEAAEEGWGEKGGLSCRFEVEVELFCGRFVV